MERGIDRMEFLSDGQEKELLQTLQKRFTEHMERHEGLEWHAVAGKLQQQPERIWSLYQMEQTGGEPDVVGFEKDQFIFFDCSAESPAGRRSLCYDRTAWNARKKNKPVNSAMDVAEEMGIELLTEDQYRYLQTLGSFDQKTSSWVRTPDAVRKLGGALFCDYRYGQVFLYHNGAESYYAARGFRGSFTL